MAKLIYSLPLLSRHHVVAWAGQSLLTKGCWSRYLLNVLRRHVTVLSIVHQEALVPVLLLNNHTTTTRTSPMPPFVCL